MTKPLSMSTRELMDLAHKTYAECLPEGSREAAVVLTVMVGILLVNAPNKEIFEQYKQAIIGAMEFIPNDSKIA